MILIKNSSVSFSYSSGVLKYLKLKRTFCLIIILYRYGNITDLRKTDGIYSTYNKTDRASFSQ